MQRPPFYQYNRTVFIPDEKHHTISTKDVKDANSKIDKLVSDVSATFSLSVGLREKQAAEATIEEVVTLNKLLGSIKLISMGLINIKMKKNLIKVWPLKVTLTETDCDYEIIEEVRLAAKTTEEIILNSMLSKNMQEALMEFRGSVTLCGNFLQSPSKFLFSSKLTKLYVIGINFNNQAAERSFFRIISKLDILSDFEYNFCKHFSILRMPLKEPCNLWISDSYGIQKFDQLIKSFMIELPMPTQLKSVKVQIFFPLNVYSLRRALGTCERFKVSLSPRSMPRLGYFENLEVKIAEIIKTPSNYYDFSQSNRS